MKPGSVGRRESRQPDPHEEVDLVAIEQLDESRLLAHQLELQDRLPDARIVGPDPDWTLAGDDLVLGLDGNDTIVAGGGDDCLFGRMATTSSAPRGRMRSTT